MELAVVGIKATEQGNKAVISLQKCKRKRHVMQNAFVQWSLQPVGSSMCETDQTDFDCLRICNIERS